MARKAKATAMEAKGREGRSARAMERRVTHSVNHPVRLDALSILIERISSPKEIAKMLHVSLGTASFHVGELVTDDVIELVKTEQRRGAVEHFYRAKMRPEVSDEEWRAMPKVSRRKMATLLLQAIVAEGLSSLRHGKMDADDNLHLAWKVMRTDANGQCELAELQAEMLDRVEEIRAVNEARLSEGGDAGSVRIVAMMGFERGRPGNQPGGDALSLNALRK